MRESGKLTWYSPHTLTWEPLEEAPDCIVDETRLELELAIRVLVGTKPMVGVLRLMSKRAAIRKTTIRITINTPRMRNRFLLIGV
jgi:hypothetical protein